MASKRRPNHLTLNNDDRSESPLPPRAPFNLGLPSPRAGEQMPAMSPLDAIAMHSRQLARRFEQPAENGRRISRLPATDVARELANRPEYFRGMMAPGSGGMEDVPEAKEEASPTNMHPTRNLVVGSSAQDRPMSHYPMFGNADRDSRDGRDTRMSQVSEVSISEEPEATPFYNAEATATATPFYDAQEQAPKAQPQGYFNLALPRAMSPEPVDRRMVNVQAATPTNMPSLTSSVDSLTSTQVRTLTDGSTRSQRSLAPPRSPAFPKSPRSMQSIRSVPADSGDEDGSTNSSHAVSSSRKFSGSSGMSRPQSPFSPYMPAMARSPSITSEFSVSGSQRKMNFSRPMSSSSRPQFEHRPSYDSRSSFETQRSADLPHRHPSAASGSTLPSSGTPSRQPSGDDTVGMPHVPGAFVGETGNERPTTSYTYASFTLPRGKKVERTSRGTRESWIQRQFTWDEIAAQTAANAPTTKEPGPVEPEQAKPEVKPAPRETTPIEHFGPTAEPTPPPSEPSPSSELHPDLEPPPPIGSPTFRPSSPAGSARSSSSRRSRLTRDRAMSSATRSRSAEPSTLQKAAALHKSTPSVRTYGTESSDRTIRAMSIHARAPSHELSAEEHLEIGIQTHSAGELNKSTYHLRIAAREGSPTGMLLYALACRHGWGMRPNQEEGVRWLKKAIDGAGLQVADVEETLASASASSGKKIDQVAEAQERKKRKAQFALAIYELGISYMNGWGCAKDKPLAVQCYEVAGSWGDCDALAEAGFCYAQGAGVKKDLRRAAALYRKAAEGGMSMAGNSWIYKPKYMDEEPTGKGGKGSGKGDVNASLSSIAKEGKESKEKDGKPAGRARARSIWGRSKK